MTELTTPQNTAQATLAGGCFWCLETAFNQLQGVLHTEPGYAGGHTAQPTYASVCQGTTGHAEVVQVTYDPRQVTFRQLLEVFFTLHDPTQLNRQGYDVGPQYRSAVFYHDDEQARIASEVIRELTVAETFAEPIVTELSPVVNYHPAEAEHRDYYLRNQDQPYCQAVISPKLAKFRQTFTQLLRQQSA